MSATTQRDTIRRYPRLLAHMMCESLGYFSPLSAANALAAYIDGRPFWCEWYVHMAGNAYSDDGVLRVGREVVKNAFQRRRHHNGYMSDYTYAHKLVEAERTEEGKTHGMFAGWF